MNVLLKPQWRLMVCRSIVPAAVLGAICLGGPAVGQGCARIDATTRNHSVSVETVLIADGGTAKLPIVISDKAGKDTKARAAELASYLERITGAKFQIKTGAGGPGIFLGTIAEFPTPSAADGLKICNFYDGKEAYAIRAEAGSVKLLGATDLGVSHAMSRFLTSLGCRWFFPGPTWEVIPKISKLSFNTNETDRPELLSRSFGIIWGNHHEKTDPDAREAFLAWWRENLVGESLRVNAGDTAHLIVSHFPKEFEAHPEYRALTGTDGKKHRTGTELKPTDHDWIFGQLCVTNPGMVKLACRYADDYFDQHPDADMVPVGADDGGGWCTCPDCTRLSNGNLSNLAYSLANQVAKHLQETHPGKLVGILAYNWYCDPPDFPVEPNVYVELTTGLLTKTKYGFDRLLELWPQKCKYFGLYDYWAVYGWCRDWLPSGRIGDTGYITKQIPRYLKNGAICVAAESGDCWGANGLSYYLASRVMWNSSTDAEALKNDFYQKAFGPAAAEMKAYYDDVDGANHPLLGPAFYRGCLDDLEAAGKAAAGHPDMLARIETLKQYNVFNYLHGKLTHDEDDKAPLETQKKDAYDMVKWNYELRNSYMTNWTFFAAEDLDWGIAKRFQEPTWNWYPMECARTLDRIPYRDPNAVITPEETDLWFQKMKADYGEAPKVTEVAFSKELVAPEWNSKEQYSGPSGVARHGAGVLALASLKGEPLRFTVTQAVMYPDNSTGAYVLENMEGKEIARGDTHKGENKLELTVPVAGVYYFKYDDHVGGWCFTYDKGLRAALPLERGKQYTTGGDMWSFFYVPKNTAEIQFYASGCGGGTLGIRDPNRRWLESNGRPTAATKGDNRFFKTDASYYIIPVPKGTDGQMWTLHCSPGSFHFFNIPTILSLTPDALLVPEEVAKKDGLKY